MNAHASRKKDYRRLQWLAAITLLALLALPIWGHGRGRADDDDDNKNSPTPPGLFITPTSMPHALQQELNPGLMNYPNFVAGEASSGPGIFGSIISTVNTGPVGTGTPRQMQFLLRAEF